MSETIILQALEAILRNMGTLRTYIQALASMIAVIIGMQALTLIWMSSANRAITKTGKMLKKMYDDLQIEDAEIQEKTP